MSQGMSGADVTELRALAQKIQRAADELSSVSHRLTASVAAAPAWTGPDAQRFRTEWQNVSVDRIRSTVSALYDAATSLRSNADQQERTSAADTGATTPYAPYPVPQSIAVLAAGGSTDDRPHGAFSPSDVISDLQEAGTSKSSVEIRKILQPDGRVSYIVYVPGTQTGQPESNPFDLASDAAAFSGASTDVTRLVEDAMRQAGIGPGDPVMLAGHSLGALTIGNLAADPTFRSHYDVQSVLAVGANISTDSIPASIAVTQINNIAGDPISLGTGALFSSLDPLPQEAANLTQIDFGSIDIQPGRNPLDLFADHGNLTEYAGQASHWALQGDNLATWQASTSAFQTTYGTTTSIATYTGARTK